MHPNYLELVKMARESGKFSAINCNTNAMARDGAFYAKLIETGITSFSVSVDSLNPTVAELTRTGTDVEKLLSRIKEFRERKLPFLIQMVVGQLNSNDVHDTLTKLNRIGDLTVAMQPYINNDDRDYAFTESSALDFLKAIESSKSRYEGLTIVPHGFRHLGLDNSRSNVWLCTSPWLDPAINVDGYLTPCCVHISPATFGNLNLAEIPFDQAWMSATPNLFISKYIKTPASFCKDCSENVRRGQPYFESP